MKNHIINFTRILIQIYFVILITLIPVKFGNSIAPTSLGLYPNSIWEWVFGNWPAILLPLLSGLGLIFVIIFYPISVFFKENKKYYFLLLPWFFLAIASIVGLYASSEYDYSTIFILNFIGLFCFLVALIQILSYSSKFKKYLLIGLLIGAIYEGEEGWRQKIWGFEQTYEFAIEDAKKSGRRLHPKMLARLKQTRTFGSFTYPNSYAGYLILIFPLVFYILYRASTYVEPKKVSAIIFSLFSVFIIFIPFILSRSRGAMLAMGASIFFTFLILSISRKYKIIGALSSILCAFILFFCVNGKRRIFDSFDARLEYYKVATKLFIKNPLVGSGNGEFFNNYMRMKPKGVEETRIPHNMILNFASQTGFIGFLASILCLLIPFYMVLLFRKQKNYEDKILFYSIFAGTSAWALHSLVDFNIMIQGGTFIYALLPLLCFDMTNRRKQVSNLLKKTIILNLILLCLATFVVYQSSLRLKGEKSFAKFFDISQNFKNRTILYDLNKQIKETGKLLPYSPYAYATLGKTALAIGNTILAESAFKEAVKRTPHRSAYHLYLSQAQYYNRKPQEAKKSLEKAKNWYPYNPNLKNFINR